MDTHTQGITQQRISKPTPNTGRNYLAPATTGPVVNTVRKEQVSSEVTTKIIQEPVAPTLDGRELKELGVLISGAPQGPIFLITPEMSTEISRVYFHNGKYTCGANGARVGVSFILSARIVTGRGMFLSFNTGHQVFVPEQWFQMTWIYKDSA